MITLIPLKDLFEPVYGINLELIHLEQCDQRFNDGIKFVSRTEKNNGVSAYVKRIIDLTPNPPHTISIAVSGSVLSSFYQADEYYSGRDLYYLIPKKEMSEKEMLFYAFCIRSNKYKYNYGRAANKTLKDILIPAEMRADFGNISLNEIPIPSSQRLLNKDIEFKIENWKSFELKKLFGIRKGERLTVYNRTQDDNNIPLITASSENNGVVDFISYSDFKDEKILFERKITIDMFFNVFYHSYKYFSDDNVHTLIPKFKSNKYISLFLVSVLKKSHYKYSFGRQVRLNRITKETIKLPQNNGKPDFEFMESYIKSLPYSSSI